MTKMLSRDGPDHHIAQCEHGTVHIVWGNLTIRLRPADFVAVAGMAEDAYAKMADDASTGFQLQIRRTQLRFPPEELVSLVELMRLAVSNLEITPEDEETCLRNEVDWKAPFLPTIPFSCN
jgi:hypothetical protein